jgi:hypothetical protein
LGEWLIEGGKNLGGILKRINRLEFNIILGCWRSALELKY